MNTFNNDYILKLLREGRKIEAIKYFKEEMNCSLADSKKYIDELEIQNNPAKPGIIKEDDVLELLKAGEKLQAIKVYKEQSGCGLKEAKEYVEGLEVMHNINPVKPARQKMEGCFIATVCYGSYNAPEVIVLRRLRDNVFKQYFAGRLFIKIYYTLSPGLAKLINRSITIKSFIRKHFLSRLVVRLEKLFCDL